METWTLGRRWPDRNRRRRGGAGTPGAMSTRPFSGPRGIAGFGRDSTATDVVAGLDLRGQSFLVTGCASGLGAETMRALCGRGATVLGAARTLEGAAKACAPFSGSAQPIPCDLSEPASVRAALRAIRDRAVALDAVIANAGVMAPPRLQLVHGYEIQFFTNHVGHHLLVTGLLDRLKEGGRVVVVSSSLHRRAPRRGIELDDLGCGRGYSPWTAYAQSKLANILFARHLARSLPGARLSVNAVHPGVVRTGLQRHLHPLVRLAFSVLGRPLLKSVAQGAATQTLVAAHPAAAPFSGEYFEDCAVAQPSALARDEALAARLWATTEEILAHLR